MSIRHFWHLLRGDLPVVSGPILRTPVLSQLSALVEKVERSTAASQTAERAKAIHISSGRVFVRNNVGAYTSKDAGQFAVETIERLKPKVS